MSTDLKAEFDSIRNNVTILQNSHELKDTDDWNDMECLPLSILRGISAIGWGDDGPTLPQRVGITPIVEENKDVVLQSNSGMGKTGAYAIATLAKIDDKLKKLQAIVVSPTRPLADQSSAILTRLGIYMGDEVEESGTGAKTYTGVSVLTAVGGGSTPEEDMAKLRAGFQIMCGTPGRIKDLLKRASRDGSGVDISDIRMVVLDEADVLLNKHVRPESSGSFYQDICEIFGIANQNNTMLVSATVTEDLLTFADKYLASERNDAGEPTKPPVKILLCQDRVTLKGIRQYFISVPAPRERDYKLETLNDILGSIPTQQTIIFVNKQESAEHIAHFLREKKFSAEAMYSQLPNQEQKNRSDRFKKGETRFLVSTNLFNRGIDIQSASLVFNYDMPNRDEEYIHRIGRSGRHGKKGTAISLIYTRTESTPPELIDRRTGETKEVVRKNVIETKFKTTITEITEGFDLSTI